MIVSFDLDDTLFVSPDNYKTEQKLRFPWDKIYKERLRYGTISLIQQLREQNVQVWVYTTSYRSEHYIKSLFRWYGIRFDNIINGARHAKEVQADKAEAMPSKYPSKYRIDLHIDDDISVFQNGRTYGFKVFLIGPQDDEWGQKILNEVKRIAEIKQR